MSIRLEMLQVARLAPTLLGDSTDLVREFLRAQQNEDGGFRDRASTSDIYYTVFGLDALTALSVQVSAGRIAPFLSQFSKVRSLDFVHACCLARAWRAVGVTPPAIQEIFDWIEMHRSADGGYHVRPHQAFGTPYACFLALSAYQDLKTEIPNPLGIVQSLKLLETPDGAWANERNMSQGSTNATAAAITVLRNLSMPLNSAVGEWLLSQSHREGGFIAGPKTPIPDLLSTATALHALAGLEVSFEPLKEKCLDFIDSLWTNEGGFHGNWTDDQVDCEYTFYGLLALGHLSL